MALCTRRLCSAFRGFSLASCGRSLYGCHLHMEAANQQAVPQAQQQISQNDSPSNKVILDPLQHPDYFNVRNLINLKELFDARVHLGHKEGTLHRNAKQFVFGSRLGCLIIDLNHTTLHLFQALNFAAHIAYRDGVVLFISRHKQTAPLVEETAKACGEFSHTRPWNQGIFTNSLQQFGIVTRLPDLVIFLHTLNDVFEEHLAVSECAKMLIPSIGIVDTNCNPNLITYPVPGNDDTPSSVELYCKLFKEAILRGKAKRKEDSEKLS